MIPLGRRNVPNMIIGDDLTFRSQILNDVPLLNAVPGNNRRGNEGKPTGPIALALKITVTNTPQAVKENSTLKGVL